MSTTDSLLTIAMSTKPSSRQTLDMKKEKKTKGSTDNSVKKRKREEEQREDADPSQTEPTLKKTKKRKSKDSQVTADREVDGVLSATAPVPEKKVMGKKRKLSTETPIEVPAPIAEEKKKKKSKDRVAQSPASGAIVQAESSGVASLQKQKNKKDKRGVSAVTASAGSLVESQSPFAQQTISFYLALSPCAHDFPLEGLCAEHISPLLLTYYPPLKGVVLSYDNPRISEHPDDQQGPQASSSNQAKTVLARSIDEYAVTFVWLTADFLLFRPQRGTHMEGHVNLQNESILGLMCYNYFNAVIERYRLPKDWRWVGDDEDVEGKWKQKAGKEGEGYWVDGDGKKVEGKLVFKVRDFEATPGSETGAGSINIHGTLLPDGEDTRQDDEERQHGLVR